MNVGWFIVLVDTFLAQTAELLTDRYFEELEAVANRIIYAMPLQFSEVILKSGSTEALSRLNQWEYRIFPLYILFPVCRSIGLAVVTDGSESAAFWCIRRAGPDRGSQACTSDAATRKRYLAR